GGIPDLAVGHLVLDGVNQLNVSNGVGGLLDRSGNTLIALPAEPHRPLYRGGLADLNVPLLADSGKIVGPDIGGAAAIGTMDHDNIVTGKLDPGVGFGDLRIVPFGD